jgi:hypothetical protein
MITFSEEDLMLSKQTAAALAHDCRTEITSQIVRWAWDMNGIRNELDCTGSMADDELNDGQETGTTNTNSEDDQESFCGIEFGHNDMEISIMTIVVQPIGSAVKHNESMKVLSV